MRNKKVEESKKQISKTLRKVLAVILFLPFVIIVILAVIFFIFNSYLTIKILAWIFILSAMASIGIILLKLTGLSIITGIKNPIGEIYPLEKLGAIFALWALVAVVALGIGAMSGIPDAVDNLSNFLEIFKKNCPWWPK